MSDVASSARRASEQQQDRARTEGRVHQTDVVIVGGGLSGSLAAAVLGRAGHRVVLVDIHAVYPALFRVEKLAGDQVETLRRLGLLEPLAASATPFEQVLNVRRGRVVDRTYGQHYGIMYADMVRAARALAPPSVKLLVDRVLDVEASADRQRVRLAGADVVDARLVVLATGMSDFLREQVGMARRITFEKHSISFGFTIASRQGFGFSSLTYYGDRVADGIDYLTLFPIGEVMRANLFAFIDHRDPWVRDLRREPKATLLRTMPGLSRYLGDFDVVDSVQNWIMDLSTVESYQRDGVVLIGDAFRTSCPAAGVGVSRLLVDVERLCKVHLPRWLATPGMGVEKIAEFYQDKVKQASDHHALSVSHYRRSLTLDSGLRWSLRRSLLHRRLLELMRAVHSPRAPAAAAGGALANRLIDLATAEQGPASGSVDSDPSRAPDPA